MNLDRSESHEIERTFVVCSLNPETILKDISSLNSMAQYKLSKGQSIEIHDTYFDTNDKQLQKQNLSLRIRQSSDRYLITLKGEHRRVDGGGLDRFELEGLLSYDHLQECLDELIGRDVHIKKPNEQNLDHTNYHELLPDIGLHAIFKSSTERQVRHATHLGRVHILAELAADRVIFNIDQQEITVYVIKIEAKGENGKEAMNKISEELIERYGPSLGNWDYSKLYTGMVIARLIHEGKMSEFIDANGQLKPDSYEKIERHL